MNPENNNNRSNPKPTPNSSSAPQQPVVSAPSNVVTPSENKPAETAPTAPETATQNTTQPASVPTTPISTPEPSQPVGSLPTTPPVDQPAAMTPPKSNKALKIILIIVAVVLILAIIGGATFAVIKFLGGRDHKYSQKDLKTYTTKTYSVNYPKQYIDYSNNSSVNSDFKDINSLGIFGIKSKVVKDKFTSLILAGSIPSPIADNQLNLLLTNPKYSEQKNQLDSEVKQALNDLIYRACIEPRNNQYTSGSNDRFKLYYNISADCKFDNTDAHVDVTFGENKNAFYILLLATKKTDWKHNQQFYQDYVIKSFKSL